MPTHQFTYPKVTPLTSCPSGGPLAAAASTVAAPRR